MWFFLHKVEKSCLLIIIFRVNQKSIRFYRDGTGWIFETDEKIKYFSWCQFNAKKIKYRIYIQKKSLQISEENLLHNFFHSSLNIIFFSSPRIMCMIFCREWKLQMIQNLLHWTTPASWGKKFTFIFKYWCWNIFGRIVDSFAIFYLMFYGQLNYTRGVPFVLIFIRSKI